jgi:hypothetical protein
MKYLAALLGVPLVLVSCTVDVASIDGDDWEAPEAEPASGATSLFGNLFCGGTACGSSGEQPGTAPTGPTVSIMDPTTGKVGTEVTITVANGCNNAEDMTVAVTFAAVPAPLTSAACSGDGTLTIGAIVPHGAVTGDVLVFLGPAGGDPAAYPAGVFTVY